MASSASAPLEKAAFKPTFAKVAASAHTDRETSSVASESGITRSQSSQPPTCLLNSNKVDSNGAHPSKSTTAERQSLDQVYNNDGHSHGSPPSNGVRPGGRETDPKQPNISMGTSRIMPVEDNVTQLSSSDSAKPPSLDGKSVASAATFALDEKESLRPDDSASLRAVEEEDAQSLQGSFVAGSRVESENGDARAFRDQLREIPSLGALPHRGVPPGRFSTMQAAGSSTTLDSPAAIEHLPPLTAQVGHGAGVSGSGEHTPLPDPQLLEALGSPRDRLFVLKLEQDLIDFVNNSKESVLNLPNCNSFYRMLAHRLADYYLLGHIVDDSLTAVNITKTTYCRIPPPLTSLNIPGTAASTPPMDMPAKKIMRRGEGPKPPSASNTASNSENASKATSEVGANGSDGSGDAAGAEPKKPSQMTREEREAKYNEVRQRIFGDTKESTEPSGSESKDASRSSSTSGKKKSKKQRNNDDGFDARSQYTYYAPGFNVAGYASESTAVYFSPYATTMATGQFQVAPQSAGYNGGYNMAMPQETQNQPLWNGQTYPSAAPPAPLPYSNYSPPSQTGYELSADFQRGMQSFQSANLPSQITPKMASSQMAGYDGFRPQNPQGNQVWGQMSQQTPTLMAAPPYMPNGFSDRPISSSSQGSFGTSYAYGQLPTYGHGQRAQHPIPGSFNRPSFNPQSQTFIPGSRNGPFAMQSPISPIPNSNGNPYGPVPMNMPTPMFRPSPPSSHQPTFGSPRNPNSSLPKPLSQPMHPLPQPVSAQGNPMQINHNQTSSGPGHSTIAKWGTPSSLPPKPPPPAPNQKFGSLPAHNFPTAPRMPSTIQPPYGNTNYSIVGGGGVNLGKVNGHT